MGLKGLFTYLNNENIEGAIVEHSIDDILEQIRLYHVTNGKPAKIYFSLRAFSNYYYYYENKCRYNLIKKDFELFLGRLKEAGAELIFASKKSISIKNGLNNEQQKLDNEHEDAKKLMEEQKLVKDNSYDARYDPSWQETLVIVLAQSAKKFGSFKEKDCLSTNTSAFFAQTASDENVFAVFGLNTHYLLYNGEWKFMIPEKGAKYKMVFKEFNKQVILDHFRFNFEQFQLMAILAGNFYSSSVKNSQVMRMSFSGVNKFKKIADFIHEHTPSDKFPLQDDTIDEILGEMFKNKKRKLHEELKNDFRAALIYTPRFNDNGHYFDDKEIKEILQNNPFTCLAECILNRLSFKIASPSLYDLTIGWIQRTGGILFNGRNENWTWPIIYRPKSERLQSCEAIAEFPEMEIPAYKKILAGEVSMDEKYKTLAFLVKDTISEADLKKIPVDYLMHVILVVHLVKNDLMTITEAIAMIKAIMNSSADGKVTFPKKINDRALRASALFGKIFSIFLTCLCSCGLDDFTAELTLDNVLFQNTLEWMMIIDGINQWMNFDKDVAKELAIDRILKIVLK